MKRLPRLLRSDGELPRSESLQLAAAHAIPAWTHLLETVMKRRIIRPREAWTMVGFSRSTMYRLEAKGLFPKRTKLSSHASGYELSEIEAWIDARLAMREGKAQ